jgi:hypothetical protein
MTRVEAVQGMLSIHGQNDELNARALAAAIPLLADPSDKEKKSLLQPQADLDLPALATTLADILGRPVSRLTPIRVADLPGELIWPAEMESDDVQKAYSEYYRRWGQDFQDQGWLRDVLTEEFSAKIKAGIGQELAGDLAFELWDGHFTDSPSFFGLVKAGLDEIAFCLLGAALIGDKEMISRLETLTGLLPQLIPIAVSKTDPASWYVLTG